MPEMTTAFSAGPRKSKRKPPRVNVPMPNSATEAVIATDLTGKVVFWNQAAERTYGWKWHEAIGRSVEDLLVPQSAQPDAAKIMDQLRRGKSWTGQFKVRRRDGSEFIATVTDKPMRDEKGNLVGIIGVSRPGGDGKRR